MKNPSELLTFAISIAKEAGKIQMKYFGNISSIKKKSTNIDLITEADKESEDYLINQITNKYPKSCILSEEKGTIVGNNIEYWRHVPDDTDYIWIIDPLDGTTNFTHNLPIFSVSIAIIERRNVFIPFTFSDNSITVCGVVYNPAADKCFYAELNKGAFLNKKPIKVTSSNTLSESLLATGFPYIHDEKYHLSFEIFKQFYDKTRGLRRLGAASLDLCFVAMGRFDGYYEYGLKHWDISAGALIATEAGASVTDWDNSELPYDGSRILATNKKIHNEMVAILSNKNYDIFFK